MQIVRFYHSLEVQVTQKNILEIKNKEET